MDTLVKHASDFKALGGLAIFFVGDALTLEWKLSGFIVYLLITTAIDRYTINKNNEKYQVEVKRITEELEEAKQQLGIKVSSFTTLKTRYGKFVNVEFQIFAKALKGFYDDFKLKHRGKSRLEPDIESLKTLSETADKLLIIEMEEVKNV